MNNKKSIDIMKDMIRSLREDFVGFRPGQIYEVLKPIYPDAEVPKKEKIITYMGITFTKPSALNKKTKINLKKDGSVLIDFFKDLNNGDFLLVNKVDNMVAYCVNLSLDDNIKTLFYKGENDIIHLRDIDIINGFVKLFNKKLPIEN